VMIDLVIVCGACNKKVPALEPKVLICGEFRCLECFRKLVLSQKLAFGVSGEAKEEGLMKLLALCTEIPYANNLYEPVHTPKFVCMIGSKD